MNDGNELTATICHSVVTSFSVLRSKSLFFFFSLNLISECELSTLPHQSCLRKDHDDCDVYLASPIKEAGKSFIYKDLKTMAKWLPG